MDTREVLSLKIGTYNIRFDKEEDRRAGNSWDDRLPVISSIIQWEAVDAFGAQEVSYYQLEGMKTKLPEYSVFGRGRSDGREKGEFVPIFFKKDKFEVLDSGIFWLSETPDKPSIGWDAAIPRICTYVNLKEKLTQKSFWLFNVHLDHIGLEARKQSSRLIIEKIRAMTGVDPVVLVGDFNVDQDSNVYRIMADSDILSDSYEETSRRLAWNGTINAFDSQLWTESRIDHIFVTKAITVTHYAILTETYRRQPETKQKIKKGNFPEELTSEKREARLPSDHFPVMARVWF